MAFGAHVDTERCLKPDILLGDFNVTEDAIDRAVYSTRRHNKIVKKGIQMLKKIELLANVPPEERTTSLQVMWNDFKIDICTTAKKDHRHDSHKMKSKITALEKDIKKK